MPTHLEIFKQRKIELYIFIPLITIAVIYLFIREPIALSYNFRDELIHLDGAYRLFMGQQIYEDFITPLGPVRYFFVSLMMKFTGVEFASIGQTFAVITWLCAIYVLYLIRDPKLSAILIILVFSIVYAPRSLNSEDIGWAFTYNKLANVLCLLVLIESFILKEKYRNYLTICISAFLSVLVIFTKISYLGIAAAPVVSLVLSTYFNGYQYDRLKKIIIYFLFFLVGIFFIFALIQFNPINFINSMLLAAEFRGKILWQMVGIQLFSPINFLIFFSFVSLSLLMKNEYKSDKTLFLTTLYLVLFYFSFSLTTLNTEIAFPVFIALLLVIHRNINKYKFFFIVIFVLSFLVVIVIKNFYHNAVAEKTCYDDLNICVKKVYGYNFAGEYKGYHQTVLAEMLLEGLELVEDNLHLDTYQVATFGYGDFISLNTNRLPVKNNLLYWDAGQTFSFDNLDGTERIEMSKRKKNIQQSSDYYLFNKNKIFGYDAGEGKFTVQLWFDHLKSSELIAESTHWKLYKAKPLNTSLKPEISLSPPVKINFSDKVDKEKHDSYFLDYGLLKSGWHLPEANGVWSADKKAHLRLPEIYPRLKGIKILDIAWLGNDENFSITLVTNDVSQTKVIKQTDDRNVLFCIPNDQQGLVQQITIEVENTKIPNNYGFEGDYRNLGLFLSGIELSEYC